MTTIHSQPFPSDRLFPVICLETCDVGASIGDWKQGSLLIAAESLFG